MTVATVEPSQATGMISALDDALQDLGLVLDLAQRSALLRYLELLSQWNRTYNLTAIREPTSMLKQHLVDCLATISSLRREVSTTGGTRVLDVGSGAGLPGLVIAVAAPELEVTCVDSVGKKTAFIAHASGTLGLRNLRTVHERVEALDADPFHIITSRAFSSLSNFVEVTRPLLTSDGAWMAMKGQRPDDELAALDGLAYTFHVEPLYVPGLDAERCIAWIKLKRDSEHTLTPSSIEGVA